ncbi:MAG: Rrf2 family transcriptional regulator [Chitinophagaceae bacterium]|nr:Rrf2 family transcriptional regulator [Chitinophagaceae bacterium]
MLSHTCKTAIKAVIYLGSRQGALTHAGIKEIAGRINASEHTVGKLLQTLVKQKVINSLKGPSGGFYMTKEQLKQSIMQVVTAIDGDDLFRECGLGLRKCSSAHPCPIHNEYKAARDLVERIFSTNKIADLCKPVNSGLTYLIG